MEVAFEGAGDFKYISLIYAIILVIFGIARFMATLSKNEACLNRGSNMVKKVVLPYRLTVLTPSMMAM